MSPSKPIWAKQPTLLPAFLVTGTGAPSDPPPPSASTALSRSGGSPLHFYLLDMLLSIILSSPSRS